MSITRVAQAANVSYATAWRIINNRPCSSEQAVAAVKQAMGKLGYKPSDGPRRGRPRSKAFDGIRTRNIALLHLREGTGISTSVLDRVQRMLADINLNLIFAHGKGRRRPAAGGSRGQCRWHSWLWPDSSRCDERSDRKDSVRLDDEPRRCAKPDPWGDRVKPDHATIGQIAASHLLEARPYQAGVHESRHESAATSRSACRRFSDKLPGSAGTSLQVFSMSGSTRLRFHRRAIGRAVDAESIRARPAFSSPSIAPRSAIHSHLERRGIQPGQGCRYRLLRQRKRNALAHASGAAFDRPESNHHRPAGGGAAAVAHEERHRLTEHRHHRDADARDA